jgi:hypothetical protein
VCARAQLLDGSTLEFEATGLLGARLATRGGSPEWRPFIDRMNSAAKVSMAGRLKRMQREGSAR